MKNSDISFLRCPSCENELMVNEANESYDNEIKGGTLKCKGCKKVYVITNYIPRFVPLDNYAANFGYQWNIHDKTQIDEVSGIQISRNRFLCVTGWPTDMKGEKILEAGCGAGRFTQIVKETGAEVYTFDYSNAIDANMKNNAICENIHYFQTSIYEIPFQKESFDKVFCFGVLQHTPNVENAFMNLVPYIKPGGELVIDVYDLTFRALVNPKYWLRPFTKRINHETLYRFIKQAVPRIYPIKQFVTEKIPLIGKYLAFLIPIAWHKGFIKEVDNLSYEELINWSILDTFDKYSPQYDKPQRLSTVKKWFKKAGLRNIDVRYGPNGIVGKGIKP